MDFGLSPDDILLIKKTFKEYSKVQEVILFGSRAMGNYKPGSDIDLAILGSNITFNDILDLDNALEKLGLLYKFDLQNFKDINDPEVVEHIKRAGKLFYTNEDRP